VAPCVCCGKASSYYSTFKLTRHIQLSFQDAKIFASHLHHKFDKEAGRTSPLFKLFVQTLFQGLIMQTNKDLEEFGDERAEIQVSESLNREEKSEDDENEEVVVNRGGRPRDVDEAQEEIKAVVEEI